MLGTTDHLKVGSRVKCLIHGAEFQGVIRDIREEDGSLLRILAKEPRVYFVYSNEMMNSSFWVTRKEIIEGTVPHKIAWTATPAPNDTEAD